MLEADFGPDVFRWVEVSNVDAFQGKEKDVIIYSCVRSGGGGLGFVKDVRRMNVALTRARHALYVVGSEDSLRASDDWRALLEDARARGCWRDIRASWQDNAHAAPWLLGLVPATRLDGTPTEWPKGSRRAASRHAGLVDSQRQSL